MIKNKFHISCILLLCLISCKKDISPKVNYASILRIDIDTVQAAGNLIEGRIILEENSSDPTIVLIITGLNQYQQIKLSPPYKFILPNSFTEKSGIISLTTRQADSTLHREKITVMPANPEGVIEVFTGPKTLEVNGQEQAMTISIAQDRYGNPASNTKIKYTVDNPDGGYTEEKFQDKLQSNILLEKSSKTGKALIGVNTENSYAKESEIKFIPSWPTNFTIELMEHYPYADGRQFYKIRSSEIKDKYNNLVENGTIVYFSFLNDAEELTSYSSYTIGGTANVAMENPTYSGSIIVSAHSGSSQSNKINIDFNKSVLNFEINFDKNTNLLKVGPLFGKLNQLVPDGFIVECSVDNKYIFLEECYNGISTIDLYTLPPGRHNIVCTTGGVKENIEITR